MKKLFFTFSILVLFFHFSSYYAQEKLYFTAAASNTFAYSVSRADLDGSNSETIVPDNGTHSPQGIALDLTNNKVYYSDTGNDLILSCDFDGSNVQTIISNTNARSLAIDADGGKIYYTVTDGTNNIYSVNRADLDGSNVEVIIPDNGSINPYGIALDLTNNKIYLTDTALEVIRRCDLDGSNIENLLSARAVSIALDVAGGKLYYTVVDADNVIYTVNRADLNGDNAEVIVPDNGSQNAVDIAVDVVNSILYFSDTGNQAIRQSDLDGSNVTDLVSNIRARAITASTSASAVPVELSEFDAFYSNNQINIVWRTATEVNNSGFNLEKSIYSTDNWEKIAFIEGSGTSNSPKDYSYVDSDLPDSGKVSYRLKQIDIDGSFKYSKAVSVNLSTVTDVEDDEIKYEFALEQNYPNPFNPVTTINYSIAQESFVSLKVYSILGKEVASLVNKNIPAGSYNVSFDASSLSSGIYFYTLKAGNFIQTNKMILLK